MTPQILLVDDNALQASTRHAILSRCGLRVAVSERAQDALALLSRPDVQSTVRLLVTDHLMPGMNGPELVRRVRAMLPDLPVLVLSGLAGAESEYAGLHISFQLKPFPPEDLIRLASLLSVDPVSRSA
jgi:CheY-like chemotaxis protein